MTPETSEQVENCENCQKRIDLGNDVITTESCVLGPRGIVPLGNTAVFCSRKCVAQFFDDEPTDGLIQVENRVP